MNKLSTSGTESMVEGDFVRILKLCTEGLVCNYTFCDASYRFQALVTSLRPQPPLDSFVITQLLGASGGAREGTP
jgi:hypothetical protein